MKRTSLRPPARMARWAALLLFGLALGGLGLLAARPAGAQLPPVAAGGPLSRPLQGTATPTASASVTPCTGWAVIASADVVTATQNQLLAAAAVTTNDVWAGGV